MVDPASEMMEVRVNGQVVWRRIDYFQTDAPLGQKAQPVLLDNEKLQWLLGNDIPLIFQTS